MVPLSCLVPPLLLFVDASSILSPHVMEVTQTLSLSLEGQIVLLGNNLFDEFDVWTWQRCCQKLHPLMGIGKSLVEGD